MGHSTARAALIYQHASAARDRLIADALSDLVDKGRKPRRKQDQEPEGHAGDTLDRTQPRKHSGPGGGMIL
ncbi:hypothetical protein CEB94_14130 [Streptomyces hawaiiensis]|uniref:Uncharacterized protein n=1 Tax=Streptomyces hawaiiensis TaxID=67305 RepID=A0A6G5RDJ0_9ACTN|nr:hypothetical protein CEB94_14130 [Streptomyces hawaiiensis]